MCARALLQTLFGVEEKDEEKKEILIDNHVFAGLLYWKDEREPSSIILVDIRQKPWMKEKLFLFLRDSLYIMDDLPMERRSGTKVTHAGWTFAILTT